MSPPPFKKLSVVVACHNESANLKQRFPNEVLPVLRESGHELILIDDGSTDDTWAAIQELRARFQNVVALKHEHNRGLGAALRTGFSNVTGDLILTMDADLTFHLNELPVMLAAYGPDVDCVMGSPFLGKMQGVSLVRRILSWCVNTIYKFLLKANISSVSSIFRLYRTSFLKSLTLTCDSFDINAEILFLILATRGVVKEVPVTLGTRMYGVSKINTAREIKNHFKMFAQILQWKIKKQK